MREQPFYHDQRSAAEEAPAPTAQLNRAAIQISWNEGAVTAIKIEHQAGDLAWKVGWIQFKPDSRQGLDAQSALNAELQMIFASRQGSRAN